MMLAPIPVPSPLPPTALMKLRRLAGLLANWFLRPQLRYPITVIADRRARAASGHAAALPSSAMNLRRLMGLSLQPRLRVRGYHIRGDAYCAPQQISAAHVGLGSVASHPDVRDAPGMSAMPPIGPNRCIATKRRDVPGAV